MSRWDSRMLPASARRALRAVMVVVSCACAVMFLPAFTAVTGTPASRVFTNARDVTIVPPGSREGHRRAMIVSAPSHLLSVATWAVQDGGQAGSGRRPVYRAGSFSSRADAYVSYSAEIARPLREPDLACISGVQGPSDRLSVGHAETGVQ